MPVYTDIGIGFKGIQEDSYHDYAMPNKQITDNNLSYDTRFHYRNHNSKQKVNTQYFIETLQPIKQYGKDGKSMVFVQGRLDGNGGEKFSTLHIGMVRIQILEELTVKVPILIKVK